MVYDTHPCPQTPPSELVALFPGSSAPEWNIEVVHVERAWCSFHVPESLGTKLQSCVVIDRKSQAIITTQVTYQKPDTEASLSPQFLSFSLSFLLAGSYVVALQRQTTKWHRPSEIISSQECGLQHR